MRRMTGNETEGQQRGLMQDRIDPGEDFSLIEVDVQSEIFIHDFCLAEAHSGCREGGTGRWARVPVWLLKLSPDLEY